MNNDTGWVRISEACKHFGVTSGTLRKWSNEGKVQYKRTIGGQRVYRISEHPVQVFTDPQRFVYVRVSSKKQIDDMERQKQFLLSKYPGYQVVEDIGSGINYKRKGLRRLLLLSLEGKCDEIIVSSKDRLCRFGFELLEFLFSQNNTKLIVLDKTTKPAEQEFSEDILAILQVYCCKWNGKRRYQTNKETIEIGKYRNEGEANNDNDSKEIQNEVDKGPRNNDKEVELSC